MRSSIPRGASARLAGGPQREEPGEDVVDARRDRPAPVPVLAGEHHRPAALRAVHRPPVEPHELRAAALVLARGVERQHEGPVVAVRVLLYGDIHLLVDALTAHQEVHPLRSKKKGEHTLRRGYDIGDNHPAEFAALLASMCGHAEIVQAFADTVEAKAVSLTDEDAAVMRKYSVDAVTALLPPLPVEVI